MLYEPRYFVHMIMARSNQSHQPPPLLKSPSSERHVSASYPAFFVFIFVFMEKEDSLSKHFSFPSGEVALLLKIIIKIKIIIKKLFDNYIIKNFFLLHFINK